MYDQLANQFVAGFIGQVLYWKGELSLLGWYYCRFAGEYDGATFEHLCGWLQA